jgi:phasin family protein
MTTLNIDTLLAANKAALAEAQTMAATALAGFEKLVELNVAATKSVVLDSSADLMSVFAAKTPADALAVQAAWVKPLAERSVAYSRSVYAIASETGAALTEAVEAKTAQSQKAMVSTLDEMAKNAPAGSESVVAVIKTAVAAGQNAVESAKTATKKAVELAEKQAATVVDTALNSVKAPARRK